MPHRAPVCCCDIFNKFLRKQKFKEIFVIGLIGLSFSVFGNFAMVRVNSSTFKIDFTSFSVKLYNLVKNVPHELTTSRENVKIFQKLNI